MKRLTTEFPKENFEIMLNYVYSKEGWAHIRHDGERENVFLTQWARTQCLRHGCSELPAELPEEIDEALCGCMMDAPDCPVALAYCFACQASHLRDRLKLYEDVLFSADGRELITPDMLRERVIGLNNAPLTLEELRGMNGEPVYLAFPDYRGEWALVRVLRQPENLKKPGKAITLAHKNGIPSIPELVLECGGKIYRRKPEEPPHDQ